MTKVLLCLGWEMQAIAPLKRKTFKVAAEIGESIR
jgi:hypothetical protein